MQYLEPIDYHQPGFGAFYDELPFWSAPFALHLLDRIPITGGLTYLDVGAGTGFLTLELAQRCGEASKVIAVDPWKSAMSRLRDKLEFLRLQNVELIERDASQTELPDASIDVIASNLGINNFEHPRRVLSELFRVSKPSGQLFLTTNLIGHMAEFYDVFRATLDELGMSDRQPILDEHINERGSLESVSRLLSDSGFTVLDSDTDEFRLRFADGTALMRHHFIRLGFIQSWASIVDEKFRGAVFQTLENNLNETAKKRGKLSLTIPLACIIAERQVDE